MIYLQSILNNNIQLIDQHVKHVTRNTPDYIEGNRQPMQSIQVSTTCSVTLKQFMKRQDHPHTWTFISSLSTMDVKHDSNDVTIRVFPFDALLLHSIDDNHISLCFPEDTILFLKHYN